jgi:hypothetical protein
MAKNKEIINKRDNKYHIQMKSGKISISKFNENMVKLDINKLDDSGLCLVEN